ncbi:MAG: PQQ-like beta-propeller repeat protein [Planctomyces sp.]|nr:PQQ-like beta-propeller repeat protein [Planctomyces sp.]
MAWSRCEMRRLSIAAVLCCLGELVVAGDWTEFRGPAGQGISAARDLPATWSESENVAWKTPLPGLGWSSPAIVEGRIFLTTAVPGEGEDQSLQALCLAADSGEVLWAREVFSQRGRVEIHKKNSHASASPIVADGRVYVHFGPHGTAALSLDGDILWKTNELRYAPLHGVGGSPALFEDRLIICCDGHDVQYVAALDAATGDVLWKRDRGLSPAKGFSFGTPLVIEVNGKPQAICPGSDAVMAYDPRTGEPIWQARYEGYSVVPRPVYSHGLVIVSSGYDSPKAYAIDPGGRGDVTDSHVRWTLERGAPTNPSPVVVEDDVYFVSDNGVLTCAAVETGRVRWVQRLGGAFSASLLAADGRIYAQDEQGTAHVFAPGPKFERLAENQFADGGRTYASYAAIDGALFIRSESHLYRIESGR